MSPQQRHRLLDRLGATGSLLCALHCALLPVLIALLPSMGFAGLMGDGIEEGFVLFASLLGLFTIVQGYRRHRAVRALWAALEEPLHHDAILHAVTMTFGGTLVGLAHLANLRLSHGHVHDATCAH